MTQKILVVDGERDLVSLIELKLKNAGYEIIIPLGKEEGEDG